jgi:hypothetical protein
MFSLRLVACGVVFLLLAPSSGSAEPDFNITEIDVDWQLASLPLPPDLEQITTSAILEIASLSRALKDRSTYLPAITEVAAANGVPPALVDAVVRIEPLRSDCCWQHRRDWAYAGETQDSRIAGV